MIGKFNSKKRKISKLDISILIGLFASILLCFTNILNQTTSIGNRVLRLHILANSNSKEDQNLKLKVRDEIFKNYNFKNYGNDVEKAKSEAKKLTPQIEKTAKDVISKEGFCYDVKAEVTKMNFGTRENKNFALPAGNYNALKISIGKAEGKNWWCIINPPSWCIPIDYSENSKSDENLYDVLNEDEKDLVEKGSKTEIRFWLLDTFNFVSNLFQNKKQQ